MLWSESFHCTCQNSEEVVVYSCQTKRFRTIYLFRYKFSLIIICYSIALINCLPPSFAPCSLIDLSTLSSLCNYICIRVKSVCNGLKPDWTKQIFPFCHRTNRNCRKKKKQQCNWGTGERLFWHTVRAQDISHFLHRRFWAITSLHACTSTRPKTGEGRWVALHNFCSLYRDHPIQHYCLQSKNGKMMLILRERSGQSH